MNFTQDQINQIKDFYLNQNKSCNWIGNYFGCFHSTISSLLKKDNLLENKEIRLKKYKRKINENFFEKIDTEEKAYWLGFLYADGNVSNEKQKNLQICLSSEDKEHLLKFSEDIESEYSVGEYNYKSEVVQLRIPNEKIVNDLINCGCFPRKTFILKAPSKEIVPDSLKRHFIRGYFDGDGCKSKTHLIFLGTENLLNWISKELPIEHKTKVIKPNGKNIYRFGLSVSSLERDKKIYDYFYKDSKIFLERKRVKFLSAFA